MKENTMNDGKKLTFEDIRNETDYKFVDIEVEQWREYGFGGVHVRINNPVGLAVSGNGHRVIDANGICHYIGFDGFYLKWKAKEGGAHFVK